MKKRFIRIFVILLFVTSLVTWQRDLFLQLFQPKTVKAFGDLMVNFHVPVSAPIFTITTAAPGQTESRTIDVTNSGSVARFVAIKGIKTTETGGIASALSVVIKDGLTDVYGGAAPGGAKHLSDFFTESVATNGILLFVLPAGGHKTLTMVITFDSGAGNTFQGKTVVFDVHFGIIGGSNVVINEVFYHVDASHGFDSPKDRGVVSQGNDTVINVTGGGTGSTTTVSVNQSSSTSINQSNSAKTTNKVSQSATTGNNKVLGSSVGTSSITTGSVNQSVMITNGGNTNIITGNTNGKNDEWVELYNPTDHDINLKNFKFVDNGGTTTIAGNRIIGVGKFALVSKDSSTWTFWSLPAGVFTFPLGQEIGNGLENGGDHLLLKDAGGTTIDALSWGSDGSIFTIPSVLAGHSLSRKAPGFDTDSATDWLDLSVPSPGL